MSHAGGGRRPTDGSFPACPINGICRAQSVRTHEACRNCALSNISLEEFIQSQGTMSELRTKIPPECLDLLERLVDNRNKNQENPPFVDIVLDIYATFGKGCVDNLYLSKIPLQAPRPGDSAHARMILETLNLTCYEFNPESDKCKYIEDLIYCKRHTRVLTLPALNMEFQKFISPKECIKRKYKELKPYFKEIKNKIRKHESQLLNSKRDNTLRKRFNQMLIRLAELKACP